MPEFRLVDGGPIDAVLIASAVVMGLYFARQPMRAVIAASCTGLAEGLRFSSRALAVTRGRLVARNREVLLAAGRDAAARLSERELDRYSAAVRRDLGGFPALHQELSEQARRLDDDYGKSAGSPPTPPGWAEAVQSVATVEAKADPVLRQVLTAVHESFKRAGEEAAEDYRRDCRTRHKHLHAMAPTWREAVRLLDEVKGSFETVNERASAVDRQMDKYEEIARGEDRAAAALQSSALVQFFVSGLVLLVATGGAVVNFHLIARPMSEMVGGNAFIGGFRTADIAALVIILVELTMGLFLMECLRITNLFPAVSALADKVRRRLAFAAFTILFLLAGVEAGLAYMRELLLHDELATSALLRGDAAEASAPEFLWITTAAQMGMGFILPFALTFIAIPLETFVHSMRAVLGWIASGVLLTTSFALRLVARGLEGAAHVLTDLYDVAIFAPLWVERRIAAARGTPPAIEIRQRARKEPAHASSEIGAKAVMKDVEERLAS
ncbi:MAG: hypothetical protein AAFR11_00700 [Pseudomonadota bacterium]